MRLLALILLLVPVATFAQSSSPAAADLTTTSGKTYKHAKVFRVEPDGITYMYDGGMSKIDFLDLPEAIRRQYVYDPKKAAAFVSADEAEQARLAQAGQRDVVQAQATEQQKKEAEAERNFKWPKPVPGEIGEIGNDVLRVSGRVLQVLDSGILIAPGWVNEVLEQSPGHYGGRESDKVLMILGKPGTLVDNDRYAGVVYPAGTYRYTSVSGAVSTVPCYAISPAVAIKRLKALLSKDGKE